MSAAHPTQEHLETTAFSERLKAGTWRAHEGAEEHGFAQALIAGELPHAGYADLVAQHYFLYTALEETGRALADDPVGRAVYFPELHRLPALERDLAFLYGPEWRTTATARPSTLAYAERVRQASKWPPGFVAHHYTRYLGDLSGGQIIKKTVRRAYGFHGDEGTEFYVFDQIRSLPKFKNGYRAALNALKLDDADQQRVIDEVHHAYRLNNEMMADLGRFHTPAR